MDARIVPARHQHDVAIEALHELRAPGGVDLREIDGLDPQAADGAEHGCRAEHADARGARCFRQRAGRLGAQIGDCTDFNAGRLQVERRLVRRIIAGHDDGARSDPHAIAIQIGARSAREHDARPIVAGKHQRTLDRTGGEHDGARAHLPQTLARRVRRRLFEMIR